MLDKGEGWSDALGEETTNPPTPRASGETLFILDREWTVSKLEQRIKGQFEQWVRRNAREACKDDPFDQELHYAAYQGNRAAGHYSWDGKWIRSALNDLPGIHQLLFLLLRRCHTDVTLEEIHAMVEENSEACADAIRWARGNSQAPAKKTGANGQKPVTMDSQ